MYNYSGDQRQAKLRQIIVCFPRRRAVSRSRGSSIYRHVRKAERSEAAFSLLSTVYSDHLNNVVHIYTAK